MLLPHKSFFLIYLFIYLFILFMDNHALFAKLKWYLMHIIEYWTCNIKYDKHLKKNPSHFISSSNSTSSCLSNFDFTSHAIVRFGRASKHPIGLDHMAKLLLTSIVYERTLLSHHCSNSLKMKIFESLCFNLAFFLEFWQFCIVTMYHFVLWHELG